MFSGWLRMPGRAPAEDGEDDKMKIVESVCGNCGAKDTLFPVPVDEGPQVWRCEECGGVFREHEEADCGGESGAGPEDGRGA